MATKPQVKDLSKNLQNGTEENGFNIRIFHLPKDPENAIGNYYHPSPYFQT